MKEQACEVAQSQGQSVPLFGRRDEVTEPDRAPSASPTLGSHSRDASAGPRRDYSIDLSYQRSTRSARSEFQRLALPTPVSISKGIYSG